MERKIFAGEEIIIRKLSQKDLKNVKKFQEFINSLVKEEAKIALNKKFSLAEEKKFLEEKLKGIKNREQVFLIAEYNTKIIGTTGIDLDKWRKNHVGNFGITIRAGYRGIGLGQYLMAKILELAKKELKPKPKIIKLSVYPNNKPANSLYKKFGFKKVAEIPRQIQYKNRFLNEIIMISHLK